MTRLLASSILTAMNTRLMAIVGLSMILGACGTQPVVEQVTTGVKPVIPQGSTIVSSLNCTAQGVDDKNAPWSVGYTRNNYSTGEIETSCRIIAGAAISVTCNYADVTAVGIEMVTSHMTPSGPVYSTGVRLRYFPSAQVNCI